MSAEQRAELANMALAEVGVPHQFQPAPEFGAEMIAIPRHIASGPHRPMFLRARELATLHLYGPDYPVLCRYHTNRYAACEMIGVGAALLGHGCGAA